MKSIASLCTLASAASSKLLPTVPPTVAPTGAANRPLGHAPARQGRARAAKHGATPHRGRGRLPDGSGRAMRRHQTAGHLVHLREPYLDLLRQAEDTGGSGDPVRVCSLIVMPVIVRQRVHWHGDRSHRSPGTITKRPKPGHAGNPCQEPRAGLVGHICREIAVDRIAFGQRRPPLGRGDVQSEAVSGNRATSSSPSPPEPR